MPVTMDCSNGEDFLWFPRAMGTFYLETSSTRGRRQQRFLDLAKCTIIGAVLFVAGILKIVDDIDEPKLALFIMEMAGTVIMTTFLPLIHFYNQWRHRGEILEAIKIIEDVHKQLCPNERAQISTTRSYLAICATVFVVICELATVRRDNLVQYSSYFIVYYAGLVFELSVATEFNILAKAILTLRGRMIASFQDDDSNDMLVPWRVKMENRLLNANVNIYKAYELILTIFIAHYFSSVFFLVYLLSDIWTDMSYPTPTIGRLISLCYLVLVQGPPLLVAGPAEKHLNQMEDLDNALNKIWPSCSIPTQDLVTMHYLRKRHLLAKQASCYKMFPVSYSTLMSAMSTSIMYVVIIFQLGV